MRKKLALLFAVILCTSCTCGANASEDTKQMYQYPIESIIANPDEYRGVFVEVMGYVSIKEDGIALYYSKRDYKYETNECAIWLPEREDMSVEKYAREMDLEEGRQADIFIGIEDYELGGECAAVGTYLKKDQDKEGYLMEGQRYKNKPPMMQVYRQEEEVSMYRVMARPWDYYGRTIWMECVKDTGGTLYPNNELKTDSERDIGIVGANMDIVDGKPINLYISKDDEEIDGDIYGRKLMDRYGLEESHELGAIGAIGCRFQIECKIYLEAMGDFSCISRSGLLYQEKDLVIDEKDLDKFYAVVEMGK